MGASSSSDRMVSSEQREVESLPAAAGALPMLRKAFADLADPQTSAVPVASLQVLRSALEHAFVSFSARSQLIQVANLVAKLTSVLNWLSDA